jgi:type IV pilus assembly protein PilY1
MMNTVWEKRLTLLSISALSLGVSAAPLDLATAPLSVSTTTQPNVMLLLDNSQSMRDRPSGSSRGTPSKIDTAKQVAKNVIAAQSGMNFGLAVFGYWGSDGDLKDANDGGTVLNACEDRSGEELSDSDSIYSSIDDVQPDTWTPLAEALYEVTRYYRGMSTTSSQTTFPAQRTSGISGPIAYRCQKNFTIVLTDGYPTADTRFPSDDPADMLDNSRSLPDWDNNATNDGPNNRGANSLTVGNTLFLDDVALFGHDIDFKITGNDLAGKSFNDPDFRQQNMSTYTIGFDVSIDMLREAADNNHGNGEYYEASDASDLQEKLADALKSIAKRSASSSSAAANTGRLTAGSYVYQARFNSAGWGGQLLAFAIDSDKTSLTYGQILTNTAGEQIFAWDAGSLVPEWADREIFTNETNGASDGQVFRWDSFSSTEKTAFFGGDTSMLNYIRGQSDLDKTVFRERVSGLGDIVYSTPYYVGKPSARYLDTIQPTVKYSDFVALHANRTPILYVGANDGMLHGFDVSTGVEKVAFIPHAVLPNLKNLADLDYSHQYFVDGSPTVVDAFVSGAWRSVLAGGLNGGGQGIYALNVTDPASFDETGVNATKLFMWEFTDSDDADLGFSYSRPKIVKLEDGKWYAVFGNGFNNTVNDVDLADKSNYYKLSTDTGMEEDPDGINRPNGFASVTTVDLNGDMITDHIYAGDLFGNVWKFSLKGNVPANWGMEYKLFETSTQQPITSALTVGRSKSGTGQMVYFGTGKYLETDDNNGATGGIQTFYAIHDKESYTVNGSSPVIAGRGQLLEQTITHEQSFSVLTDVMNTPDDNTDDILATVELRETSNNVSTQSADGWYLDLVYNSIEAGERIVSAPALRGEQIVFVTNVPAADPCSPGGDSWVMKLDAFSGKRLTHTYDVNSDGRFTAADRQYGNGDNASTGIKVNSGNSPSFMPDGDADKILISTNNGIKVIDSFLGQQVNRQSWQQLVR